MWVYHYLGGDNDSCRSQTKLAVMRNSESSLPGFNLHPKIVLLINKLFLTVQPNILQIPVIIATTRRHVLPPQHIQGVCIKSWLVKLPWFNRHYIHIIGRNYNSAQVSKSTFSASSVPSFSRIDSCSPAIFEWCALIKTQGRWGLSCYSNSSGKHYSSN